jgi:hypothetical protein
VYIDALPFGEKPRYDCNAPRQAGREIAWQPKMRDRVARRWGVANAQLNFTYSGAVCSYYSSYGRVVHCSVENLPLEGHRSEA